MKINTHFPGKVRRKPASQNQRGIALITTLLLLMLLTAMSLTMVLSVGSDMRQPFWHPGENAPLRVTEPPVTVIVPLLVNELPLRPKER